MAADERAEEMMHIKEKLKREIGIESIEEHDAQVIDKFTEALKSRLGDAIYPQDFESMRNLIDDVARSKRMAMVQKNETPELVIAKRRFAIELKQMVHQKCEEINHYVSGCNSPFSYMQIYDVQEHLRGIEEVLNIKIKEQK